MSSSTDAPDEPKRLEINWAQTIGGALAAVSSAVLLSTLGVAGTIIGAAAGSIVVTVGSAVYTHSLAVSKERVAAARIAALEAARRSRTSTGSPRTSMATTTPLAQTEPAATNAFARQRPSMATVSNKLPWGRIAAAAVAVFVLAMGAILTFELATGQALSRHTGGSGADAPRTSLGGGSDSDKKPDQNGEPTRSGETEVPEDPGATSDAPEEPDATPTESTPETTAPPTEEPEEPAEDLAPTPTDEPSAAPTE